MTNSPQKPKPDAFHRQRSKCIDAFAALEEAIIGTLLNLQCNSKCESLGLKIEAIRKVCAEKSPQAKCHSLLDDCERMSSIRNDLVHSRLQVIDQGDRTVAWFANTRELHEHQGNARIFTLQGLLQLYQNVNTLADEVRKLKLNPPSSPLPPSPGAAAGP
jgi:hypothetical protein